MYGQHARCCTVTLKGEITRCIWGPLYPPLDAMGDHKSWAQTINRAELTAAILTHEAMIHAAVVTNSAYVIDAHNLIRKKVDVSVLHKLPNWDLLKRLHNLFWQKQYPIPVAKIKAHQSIKQQPAHETLHIMGNAVADEAAKIACNTLHRVITDDLRRLFSDARAQQQSLEAQ